MKSFLVTAAFSVAAMSMVSVAQAGEGQAHGGAHGQMHEEHASPVGQPGKAENVKRTVTVDMTDDMRFNPPKITVRRGETVKFVVRNSGNVKHEMVLGSARELKEHAEMMRKMPGMAHADENAVQVDPGKTGELVWRFSKAGTFDFACLQPGHFEAGMKGKIAVQ